MNEIEIERMKDFEYRHKGHNFYKDEVATGIGTTIYVICVTCNSKSDITNYDDW